MSRRKPYGIVTPLGFDEREGAHGLFNSRSFRQAAQMRLLYYTWCSKQWPSTSAATRLNNAKPTVSTNKSTENTNFNEGDNVICAKFEPMSDFAAPLSAITDPSNPLFSLSFWSQSPSKHVRILLGKDGALHSHIEIDIRKSKHFKSITRHGHVRHVAKNVECWSASRDSLVCVCTSLQGLVVLTHDPNKLSAYLKCGELLKPEVSFVDGSFTSAYVWRATLRDSVIAACSTTGTVNIYRYHYGDTIGACKSLKVKGKYGKPVSAMIVPKSGGMSVYMYGGAAGYPMDCLAVFVIVATSTGHLLVYDTSASADTNSPVFVADDEERLPEPEQLEKGRKQTHGTTSVSYAMEYAHKQRRVIVGTCKSLVCFSLDDDGVLRRVAGEAKAGDCDHVLSMALAADDSFLLAGHERGVICVWDVRDMQCICAFDCFGGKSASKERLSVTSLSVSHDNHLVAVGVAHVGVYTFSLIDAFEHAGGDVAPLLNLVESSESWNHFVQFYDFCASLRPSSAALHTLLAEAEAGAGESDAGSGSNGDDDLVTGHMSAVQAMDGDVIDIHTVVLDARDMHWLVFPDDSEALSTQVIRRFIYTDLGDIARTFDELACRCGFITRNALDADDDARGEAAVQFGDELATLLLFTVKNRQRDFSKLLFELLEYLGGFLLYLQLVKIQTDAQARALDTIVRRISGGDVDGADELDVDGKALIDLIAAECIGRVARHPGEKSSDRANTSKGARWLNSEWAHLVADGASFTPLHICLARLFDNGRLQFATSTSAHDHMVLVKSESEETRFHSDILRDRGVMLGEGVGARNVNTHEWSWSAFCQLMRFVYTRSFASISHDDARFVEPLVQCYIGEQLCDDERLLVAYSSARAFHLRRDASLFTLYLHLSDLKRRQKFYNASLLRVVKDTIASSLAVPEVAEEYERLADVSDLPSATLLYPLIAHIQVTQARLMATSTSQDDIFVNKKT